MEDRTALKRAPARKLGKYLVRDLLSRGSMGMVFLAHDPVLEREVAVKVMVGSSVRDEKMKARFEREAKAVARLHHPNIVTIHDLGYDPWGSPFIAMELLDGTDLEELVKTQSPSLGRKLDIIEQVCRGLEHAHRHGIVHRDIKPANIFVTTDGTAKVMDFGVARWMTASHTQAGIVVGTAGYMAPEQLRGKPADGRSDIFSLGVVLFEILTNQSLFSGDTVESIFFQTVGKATPCLALGNGTKLPALQEILDRALAKSSADRFSSARDMAEAIQSFLRANEALVHETETFTTMDPVATDEVSPRNDEPRPAQGGSPPAHHPPSHRRSTRAPAGQPRQVGATLGPKPTPRQRPTTRVPRTSSSKRPAIFVAVILTLAAAVSAYLLVTGRPGRALPDTVAVPASVQAEDHPSVAPEVQTTLHPAIPAQGEDSSPASSAEPTARERAAILAADAALALGSGKLTEAATLIADGEELDPGNSRWARLRGDLRAKQAEAQWRAHAADQVRQAEQFLSNGEYQDAIEAFKKAMEYDPKNREARSGLERAISLKQRAEDVTATTAEPRRFVESRTEFTPGDSESNRLLGFEMEEGLEVQETADPFFPAQVIIELNPSDANPGEPFLLRVRVFNEGFHALELSSLELVSRFGDRIVGKGQPIPPRVQRVAPQATAVVHEIAGTWKESQNHGEIEATLTLTDGGKLTKSLRW